ncbi:MAG: TonB-dependent receptor [Bacteroidales bacterium]|nr:TonB-dependent receptor [Bacteroidales bacterium]
MQRIILIAVSLLAINAAVYAQDDRRGQVPDSLVYTLDRAVVVADAKPSATLQSTPLMVKTKMDFDKLGLQELYEVIKNFNGVQIRDYGGIGGVKTVSVRSMGSQHTAVNYDGITITNVQSGQVDIGRFNLDNVSQVTLTIGLPDDIFQAARNFASVGALTIKSAEPVFIDKPVNISASMRYASFKTFNPSLSYEQRLGKNFSFSANADWMKSDGTYPFRLTNGGLVTEELRKNSDVNTIRAEFNLFGHFANGSKLTAKVNYLNSERGLPGSVVFYNPKANERLWDDVLFVQLGYETPLSEKLSLLAQLKYNNTYTKYMDIWESYVGGVEIDTYLQKEYYSSVALQYKPTDNLKFAIAEDFFLNRMDSNLPNFAFPTRRTSLTSLSGQYKSARLTATANLLATYINENVEFGEVAGTRFRLSPSVSLSYRVLENHNLRLRVAYQDIFRTPTFNDLYYAKMGNTKLKPEIARQLNVGVTFNEALAPGVIDFFSVSLDGYINKVKDKIVAIPTTFISKMLNFGVVDIWGLDASLNTVFTLSENMSLEWSANYSYQNAVDVTDPEAKNYRHQIPYTPRHSGNTSLTWLNDWVNVSYMLTAVGERYALPQNIESNRINPYMEHSLSLSHTFNTRSVKLRLQGELLNLTNSQYDVIQFYPMPGRSFRLTLKITY